MAHVSRTNGEAGLGPRLIPGLVLAGLALICTSADARAAISVDHAGYKGGILTAEGRTTKAHQTVTLDGIYRARSDGSGASDSASAIVRSTARCDFDPVPIFFMRRPATADQCDDGRDLRLSLKYCSGRDHSWNSAVCRSAAARPWNKSKRTSLIGREFRMLNWALIFFIISVIAGFFGFSGVAAGAATVSKWLFFLALAIFAIF